MRQVQRDLPMTPRRAETHPGPTVCHHDAGLFHASLGHRCSRHCAGGWGWGRARAGRVYCLNAVSPREFTPHKCSMMKHDPILEK